MNNPKETDILRFCVDMAKARDDEDEVKQVIDRKLAETPDYLHAALLRVTLRVMVAQFYAPPCQRLADELGYPITEIALERQRRLNDGLADQDDDTPDPPRLQLVEGS